MALVQFDKQPENLYTSRHNVTLINNSWKHSKGGSGGGVGVGGLASPPLEFTKVGATYILY